MFLRIITLFLRHSQCFILRMITPFQVLNIITHKYTILNVVFYV